MNGYYILHKTTINLIKLCVRKIKEYKKVLAIGTVKRAQKRVKKINKQKSALINAEKEVIVIAS